MSKYQLRAFTHKDLEKTHKSWMKDLEDLPDVFPGDIERVFALATQTMADEKENSSSHGVFFDGNDVADGVVQIVVTKKGKKFVKMMDCFIRPRIDKKAMELKEPESSKAIDIYFASIYRTLELGDSHEAQAIKVYGRTDALLSLLKSTGEALSKAKENHGIESSIEGRWLVLKATKPEESKHD